MPGRWQHRAEPFEHSSNRLCFVLAVVCQSTTCLETISLILLKYNWDLFQKGTFTHCYWFCVVSVSVSGQGKVSSFYNRLADKNSKVIKKFVYIWRCLTCCFNRFSLRCCLLPVNNLSYSLDLVWRCLEVIIVEYRTVKNFMKLYALSWLLLRCDVAWLVCLLYVYLGQSIYKDVWLLLLSVILAYRRFSIFFYIPHPICILKSLDIPKTDH